MKKHTIKLSEEQRERMLLDQVWIDSFILDRMNHPHFPAFLALSVVSAGSLNQREHS
jgi:hypothetical protein